MRPWKTIIVLAIFSNVIYAKGGDVNFRSESRKDPNDYLFGKKSNYSDPIFDKAKVIQLNVDLGIASDCGQINIHSTLQTGLRNLLDEEYFKKVGQDIMAGAPMLLTCYLSPTWCAILKNARIQADFLAQLRLNQCGAINKYIDQRQSDYHEQRSKCVQEQIEGSGGNFEKAIDKCNESKEFSLKDWAGGSGQTIENRLLDGTAKWAGLTGDKAERMMDITKALIGDTVIQKGRVSVDYGTRSMRLTPRTYLNEIKSSTFKKLCEDLLPRLVNAGAYGGNAFKVIKDNELKDVSGTNNVILDRQTLTSLAFLPREKRVNACRQLSDALATGTFTKDMEQTLDFLSSVLPSNPHLPEKHRTDADRKRRSFKDQVELTLDFEKQTSEPLNQVLYRINQEGSKYLEKAANREIRLDGQWQHSQQIDGLFFDCADRVNCK